MSDLSVSTVIPTYNRAHLVGRAVSSVLAASSPGDEVIVIDDGSTDDTEGALAPFGDKIRYIRTLNRGAGAARNRGIQEARNPLVAFLDSDDEWMPDILTLSKAVLKACPEVLFSFSNLATRDISGNYLHDTLASWHKDTRSWDEILGPSFLFSSIAGLPEGRADFRVHIGSLYLGLMSRAYVSTITLVVRREAAGEALWFPDDVPLCEDWIAEGRLAGAGVGAYLDCETAIQYHHSAPRLTNADELTRATTCINALERVWGADARFLSEHGDIYQKRLSEQRLLRSRWLLILGRMAEARAELSLLSDGGPSSYRALAALPGPLVRGVLSIYRFVKRIPGSVPPVE
jgi:glycosyltransferase involved in cell wall biosynthesis